MNLWNENIDEFKAKKNDIVSIKNVKIGEYHYEKNLSLTAHSIIQINPNILEVEM